MIPLNYHHLYYFWVTARAGSISGATKELLLAQPTLSVQLAQLEASFGKKLLQRSRRGVSLTPAGHLVFEHCERIFRHGEALMRAMQEDAAAQAPPFRLGVSRTVSREVVLSILEAVESPHTRVQTVVFTDSEAALQERLASQALDMTATSADLAPGLGRGFRARHAAAVPLFLAAAPKLLRSLGGFPPKRQPVPMLLRSAESPMRAAVEKYLRGRGLRYSVVAEVADPDLIRYLAIKGKGVAAVSELALRDDLAAGRLVSVQRKPTGIREHLWLTASAHAQPHPALARLIDRLMGEFRV